MPAAAYDDFQAADVRYEDVAQQYRQLREDFASAESDDDRRDVLARWDVLRRHIDTWENIIHLRFEQDTTSPQYKKDRDYCDQLRPKLTELATDFKRELLAHESRPALSKALGVQAYDIWETDVLTYDPGIADDLVRESKLELQYTELLASAKLPLRGKTYNLEGIAQFANHGDRQLRHEAEQVKWSWFAENGEQLDRLYDDLVRLRHEMARKLGFENFIGLAYKRMNRTDYGPDQVAAFRHAVLNVVTPAAVELRKHQTEVLGVERLMAWDEVVFDPQGNPRPQGEHDWLIEQARRMFNEMGGGLGEFFQLMLDAHLLDLKNREGKAGGGFCTVLPDYGAPFIFANFNGSKGDVEVFTHEMGHAFQVYSSLKLPLIDYIWPTSEACEIHSMGLEFLTWPHMDKFFGEAAERFRRIHLTQSLLFLPYACTVDHYQHAVYENPEATPAERKELYRQLELQYMPWRDYGDLEYPAAGGRWQLQRHIYLCPFYYIDYALALVCALQLWVAMQGDPAGTMRQYVELCQQGGKLPFQQLVRESGLKSPFDRTTLEEVIHQARAETPAS